MRNLRLGGAVLMVAASLTGGISAIGHAKPVGAPQTDGKSAMERLQFLVGRFTMKPIGSKSSDGGMTVENSVAADGASLRQVVRGSGGSTSEKMWTFDADKKVYHVKPVAEGDSAPEVTGQFEGDSLVLVEVYPANGSTGLLPNVHDGVIEIVRVFPGGAADKAGLHKGDVITKIDGKSLGGMDYPNSMLTGSPGTDVVVTVRRKDVEHDYNLHRQSASMAFKKILSPRRGGGYRQVIYRTDVSGVSKVGSDAVPLGR